MMTEEQHYLTKTLNSLQIEKTTLQQQLHVKNDQFQEIQRYLMDYRAELDKFEMYDYQRSMHVIDKDGYAKAIAYERVEKMINSPYFGRFDFTYEGDDETESFYIGRFGHTTKQGEVLIYDWRAPVCNMYYEYELGPAIYTVDQRQFNGTLTQKKQIRIEQSNIQYVLNSSMTIQDAILQQTLHTQGSDKMKTIVTTIQREQNQIVRNESAHTLVIQGVAGSGKTAVALHRLAYYLYKYRDDIRPERIFILSPNKVFGDYIAAVLPELGEQPIRSFTIDELTETLLPSAVSFVPFSEEMTMILEYPESALAKRAKQKASGTFVQALRDYLNALNDTIFTVHTMTIAEHTFSAEYVQHRFKSYEKEPVLTRLQLMATDMHDALKQRYGRSIKIPSKNEIAKRLKKRLHFQSSFAIYKAFMKQFDPTMFIFHQKCFEYNDVYPYLYVQHYFKGIKTYERSQHFVLDEMQDYTAIQLAVFQYVFTCKRTIIGDFSQALLPFETVSQKTFEQLFPYLEYVKLTTTYRSTYDIAMYTKRWLDSDLHPIARRGDAPKELHYSSFEQMMTYLMQSVDDTFTTTAIICKYAQDVERLAAALDIPFTRLNAETVRFEKGLVLTTVQFAKGLEFDHVIVPFVDDTHYSTSFDKGLLYIATSRAMHRLTMLVDSENPSILL